VHRILSTDMAVLYKEGVIAGPDGGLYPIDIDRSVIMSMMDFYL
jgi:hypothetical protein